MKVKRRNKAKHRKKIAASPAAVKPDGSTADHQKACPYAYLLGLLSIPMDWQLLPNGGIKHAHSGVILRRMAGGLTGSFSESSRLSFPLSLWEMLRVGIKIEEVLRGLLGAHFRSSPGESLIAAVCESLMLNPEDWDVGRESLLHTRSGLELDFGLGPVLIRCSSTSQVRISLRVREKFLLWRAIRRCVRQTFVNDLKQMLSAYEVARSQNHTQKAA